MLSSEDWVISYCAGYIVPPCKGQEADAAMQRIQGSTVVLSTEVLDYFEPLFNECLVSCNIEIDFLPTESDAGTYEPQNDIRDTVRGVAFEAVEQKDLHSKELALRLALATDRRSTPGLFVVLSGMQDRIARVAMFKFPADESLQAIFSEEGLSIRVIESAFSRKTDYFKAAHLRLPN